MEKQLINREPQAHLINIIKGTKDHHPNFVLLLGAGASVKSGVKLSQEMISDWRNIHFSQYAKSAETLDQYFKRFSWYETPEEYSYLFECIYDQPSQRREYIESCLKDATPSWGYIYLVNLIRRNELSRF